METVKRLAQTSNLNSHTKAREALEKILKQVAENRSTGEFLLRIQVCEGGVRYVRIGYEEEVK